ncbi:hypothetical protein [Winogradskyella aquimaris]|uniref:MORN repeat variant n=1 Tax=Winogradskyella aquimaris TaxID=864074 RepID=A0ABU5EKG7_9FLAO|nr:hypothetical protein [Winogradskyella aquimaris]MDY2586885.1 hypothetical protein [Winogradskyella aquimaris]
MTNRKSNPNITNFIITILFVVGFCGGSWSQETFMGFIKIQDSLLIKYKVEFEQKNDKIIGYSLTDFGGEHETKSKIEGFYDEDKNLLSFKETELIYTKSTWAEEDFCNIHLEPTKYRWGGSKLMGNFKGKFSDGTECINGEIAMNSIEKIDKRVTKFTKKLKKSRRVPDSIKQKLDNIKLVDTLNLNILKKDEVTSILTKANSVSCTIYDGGQIDQDVITVYKNGKILLYKYEISNTKKVIEIPLEGKTSRITIESNSVGTVGENTTYIEIFDGINNIKTITNLKVSEITTIDIIKK